MVHGFLNSWILQNAVTHGFLNSWFQTLHATINGKVVFRWILVFVDRSRHNGNIPLPDAPTGSLNCHGQNSTQRGYTDISELAYY